MDDFFLALSMTAIALLACAGLALTASERACHAQWDESGYPIRWSVMGGCQVSTDAGRHWIPETALREYGDR